MSKFARTLEHLAFGAVLLGGLGLMVSMVLGVGDVIGTLLGSPLAGALEITESTMVLIVFGGLAYAQIRRRHLRVELVYLLAGSWLRSVMDIVATLAALVFFGLLSWQGWREAMFSLTISEATTGIVRLPLFPARFALVFGAGLMVAQLVLDLIEDFRNLGRPRTLELAPCD
ncbi:MAG: TRAP transporter small permease [Rhodobacteraceae bacterium]|jgi:TRAP-type C4-dicarboxylate transport system permease small subunit|nr:TRAP transporter small permease [Paracoccaceae bacterium]